MFYKAILLVHFVAMIAVVGSAGAANLVLGAAASGDGATRPGLRTALERLNRWLFLPGLVAAPAAGVVLWSRHSWVWPVWLRYKLSLTVVGIIGGLMYLHLFRRETRHVLARGGALDEDGRDALAASRRAIAFAGLFLLAAAAIGTLKPGW